MLAKVRNDKVAPMLNKVPQVTLIFWIIKILATTLGETGGDAVSMTMGLGYAIGSAIFIGIFAIAVAPRSPRSASTLTFTGWS